MNFRPLHERVPVRRLKEEKTPGGVITPDIAKEKSVEDRVLAVGPGGRNEGGTLRLLDAKIGDRVLFGKWSGTEIRIEGEERIVLKQTDITGVIEEPAARSKSKAA